MKNKRLVFPLIAAALLLQFFVFHNFWLTIAGRLLVYQDRISPADAILVLGGGRGERVLQGVELYKDKYGAKIIFTGEPEQVLFGKASHWAIQAQKLAESEGLPKGKSILILESKSTHDDAVLSREVCLKRNYKSLIVVTEPFHTKRSYYTFKKVFKSSGIKVMVYPVQKSWYKTNNWWKTERGLLDTNNEYVKFIFYLLKGYI